MFKFRRFLIEGAQGAVLHTGDFRAEPCFRDSISRNPFLQRYLVGPPPVFPGKSADFIDTLDTIYLDTACMLCPVSVPTKVRRNMLHTCRCLSDGSHIRSQKAATTGLIELMSLCDPSSMFFINAWTWGYEDVLKAVARAFRSKVSFSYLRMTMSP